MSTKNLSLFLLKINKKSPLGKIFIPGLDF